MRGAREGERGAFTRPHVGCPPARPPAATRPVPPRAPPSLPPRPSSWGQAESARLMHGTTALTKEQKTIVSGGAGGFVQGIVMSPLLLLKTRVMTDPVFRTSGGLFATAVASFRVRRGEWAAAARSVVATVTVYHVSSPLPPCRWAPASCQTRAPPR